MVISVVLISRQRLSKMRRRWWRRQPLSGRPTEKTIRSEVNKPHGQFVKGDLYVVILDFNGNVLANGGHLGLVGMNQLDLKDPNGKYFNREQIEVARTKGVGTVEMVFSNPVTGKVQPKTNYIRRVEGTEYLILSGAFH